MSVIPQIPRIYLASRSHRRRELLTQIGIQFDTLYFRDAPRLDADVDESAYAGEAAGDYVERIARAKAEHGRHLIEKRRLPQRLVLAADTTVELSGSIIGKPVDAAYAKDILRRLSGQTHRVLTCVSVGFENEVASVTSISEVRFGELQEVDIRRYVESGEPMDKAGAYGIQGRAGMFIEHLSGSYSGVMGLPLHETAGLLRHFGFPV